MRFPRLSQIATFAATLVLGSSLAFAAGKKDKDAEKLITQAIDQDYLDTNHDKGLEKLKKALELCKKPDACSPEVVGKIHIASATIKGVGLQKLDDAKADLVLALKADPNAKLLDGLNPPELEAKMKEAQAEVGSAGTGGGGDAAGGGSGDGGDGGKGGKEPGPSPSGDFNHTPIEESAINTPVPIFAEIPDELGATKVIIRFKPYGGTKWETLPLTKIEGGFGGEVPCAAVTTSGELRYYIVGSDETGTPVATAGSVKSPFKISIKNKLKGDAPSLPGKEPPQKCKAKEDCPPGMPGCEGANSGKAEGVICDATSECMTGLACLSGLCTKDEDAPSADGSGTQHVISLGAQFDLAYVSDGTDVCSASNAGSYVCMEQNTDPARQFVGNPDAVNGTNGISGGLAFGGARIFAGYDYFFPFGLGLGARVGFAFGGPSILPACEPGEKESDECSVIPAGSEYGQFGNSFFPAHIEARASWKFLHPNPDAGDFAPHVFIGGGGAQVNASVPVTVCDKLEDDGNGGDCPGATAADAYQLSGLTFITFGGGATYMFIRNFGLSADLKFMVLFPTVGFTISPTISPVVAF